MSLAQLVQAMEEPATQDLRAVKLLPTILRARRQPARPRGFAMRSRCCERWRLARRPPSRPGQGRPLRGRPGGHADGRLVAEARPRAVQPDARQRALRAGPGPAAARGPHPRATPPRLTSSTAGGATSPRTCAASSAPRRAVAGARPTAAAAPGRCRTALRQSLREALAVNAADLYGKGDCADDPEPSCFDQNRSMITSAIAVPPAPFQNRPTFQQTVSVERDLP